MITGQRWPSCSSPDERPLGRAPLTPPRLPDDPCVAQAVEEVPALFARSGNPLPHDGGHLGDAETLEQRAYEQLRGLILRLGLTDGAGELGAHEAQPTGSVGEPGASEKADQLGEEANAEIAETVRVLGPPELTRPDHEVGLVFLQDAQHGWQVGRVPLPVAVERGDVVGTSLAGDAVPGPQRHTVAAVGGERADERAVPLGDLGGAVRAAVVDHQARHAHASYLIRDLIEHLADVGGLVVGGDDDNQWLQLDVRIRADECFPRGAGDLHRIRRLLQGVVDLAGSVKSLWHRQFVPREAIRLLTDPTLPRGRTSWIIEIRSVAGRNAPPGGGCLRSCR